MFISYNYFKKRNGNKTIQNFKEFYREFSNNHEFGGNFTHYDHLVKNRFCDNLQVVYSAILRKSPKNILDIGCGCGQYLPLSKVFSHIEYNGLDYAEKSIQKAKKEFPNVNFYIRDAFDTKFKKNSFDCIILSSVLILYKSEGDQEKLIKECLRIMKSNGILIIVVWNASPLLYISLIVSRWSAFFLKVDTPTDFNGIHFSKHNLNKLVNKCNAKIIEHQKTSAYYGALECIRYLNFLKYKRNFDSKTFESEKQIHPQSIFKDILKQSSGNKVLVYIFYTLAKFIPSSLSFFSVSIISR